MDNGIKRKTNLILVGMMGSGKTTVGRLVADRLGWDLIDTDQLIVDRTGASIPALFQEKGEAFFRRLEKEVLLELKARKRMVVATGGGTVLDGENRRLLQETGLVIYLKTAPTVLAARVGHGEGRPLLMGRDPVQVLTALLEERETFYRQADLVVVTDGRIPSQVAEEIIIRAAGRGIGRTGRPERSEGEKDGSGTAVIDQSRG